MKIGHWAPARPPKSAIRPAGSAKAGSHIGAWRVSGYDTNHSPCVRQLMAPSAGKQELVLDQNPVDAFESDDSAVHKRTNY
jgi:hypothetical protein